MSIVLHLTTIFYYLRTKFSLGRILFPMGGIRYTAPYLVCEPTQPSPPMWNIFSHLFKKELIDLTTTTLKMLKSRFCSRVPFSLDICGIHEKNLEKEDPPLLFRWFPPPVSFWWSSRHIVVQYRREWLEWSNVDDGLLLLLLLTLHSTLSLLFLIQVKGTCYFIL